MKREIGETTHRVDYIRGIATDEELAYALKLLESERPPFDANPIEIQKEIDSLPYRKRR